ncbi:MAG: AbrB/MazE/SpoVT family DNA-binding domain-containing protein [Acidobacteriota bacterium]|nr:AbrB/MazE/SpoVT family DNA-binding domain-containing protein [Acidobacteriota bacterium]
MSKVTSKLQLTLPKALAVQYGIRPGHDVRFEGAGEVIRMVPEGADHAPADLDVEARLRLFDAATARQEERQAGRRARDQDSRGWTREELYERGRSRPD